MPQHGGPSGSLGLIGLCTLQNMGTGGSPVRSTARCCGLPLTYAHWVSAHGLLRWRPLVICFKSSTGSMSAVSRMPKGATDANVAELQSTRIQRP